jgi:hypothetical protein
VAEFIIVTPFHEVETKVPEQVGALLPVATSLLTEFPKILLRRIAPYR